MAQSLRQRPLTCDDVAAELGYSTDYFYRVRASLEQLGLVPIPAPADGRKHQRKYDAEVVARFKKGLAQPIAGFVPAANLNDDLEARLAARGKMVARGH